MVHHNSAYKLYNRCFAYMTSNQCYINKSALYGIQSASYSVLIRTLMCRLLFAPDAVCVAVSLCLYLVMILHCLTPKEPPISMTRLTTARLTTCTSVRKIHPASAAQSFAPAVPSASTNPHKATAIQAFLINTAHLILSCVQFASYLPEASCTEFHFVC